MPAVAYCEAYKQKHHADTRPEYRLRLEILSPRRIESEIQYKYQTRMKTRNTEPKENWKRNTIHTRILRRRHAKDPETKTQRTNESCATPDWNWRNEENSYVHQSSFEVLIHSDVADDSCKNLFPRTQLANTGWGSKRSWRLNWIQIWSLILTLEVANASIKECRKSFFAPSALFLQELPQNVS